MSQHDMNIANQSGANFRSDLNDALGAIVSNSSGATEPTTTVAYQMWVDTSGSYPVLKMRDGANATWIALGRVDTANFALLPLTGGTLTGSLTFSNTDFLKMPVGTTAQRPGSPADGMIRYNSTTSQFEGYKGAAWGALGGSGSGQGEKNYIGNPDAETSLTTGWATASYKVGFTADTSTDVLTIGTANFSLPANSKVYLSSSGTLPSPLTAGTVYYWRTDNKLATTVGGSAIDITTTGTGTHTLASLYPYCDNSAFVPPAASLLTLATQTSNILEGNVSFRLTKASGFALGEFAKYSWTAEKRHQGRVMRVRFPYLPGSGFTDGALQVRLFDVTNNVDIEPSPASILNVGVNADYVGEFQLPTNSLSFELRIFCATHTTTAFTFDFDAVFCGPSTVPVGAAMSDWTAYTPTFVGMGTVTAIETYWRRVGDSIEIMGNWTVGTPTAVTATMTLPPGYSTADTTKIPTIRAVGTAYNNYSLSGGAREVSILATASQSTLNFSFPRIDSTTDTLVAGTGSNVFHTGEKISVIALRIPAAGLSSNVVMSSDNSTRVVAFRTTGTPSGTLNSSNNTITWPAATVDTHGGWNGSTTYTIPTTGYYNITASAMVNATYTAGQLMNIIILRNGTHVAVSQVIAQQSTSFGIQPNARIDGLLCNAGDTITTTARCGGSSGSYEPSVGYANFAIVRTSGPSQIAASELIACRYTLTSGASIQNTQTLVTYATKDFDTHGAYSSGVFTCPAAGKYRVFAVFAMTTTAASVTAIIAYKNGAQHSIGGWPTGTTSSASVAVSALIECKAGDTIDIRANNSSAGAIPTVTTAGANYLTIERVGL